jgi:hypothetical protein
VQNPAATLTMNEKTVLIVLIGPHPSDPACLAMRTPERRIDLIVGVERSNNDIGDTGIAVGVTGFAGELDPDLPKLRWQRSIQDRFGMRVGHFGMAP